jgi:hypothetical protein
MATATVTLTVTGYPNGVDNTQRHEVLFGQAALAAGGTYAANGLPFVWAFLEGIGGQFIPNFSTMVPVWAEFQSLAGGGTPTGTPPSSMTYAWDTVHQTLRIFVGGTELAAAAAIPADTIGFRAEFNRGR